VSRRVPTVLPGETGVSEAGVEASSEAAVIRASEIGQYVFCRRAWWLYRVCGYRSSNQAALAAGVEYHAWHGRAAAASQRWQRIGYLLLTAGILVAMWAFLQVLGHGL
jgi:hypothetical protein